jgi:small-conductance mechanosensitive channel
VGLRSGVVLLAVGVVLLTASDRAAVVLSTPAADLGSVGCVCLAAGALTLPVRVAVGRLRARRPAASAVLVDAVPPV